MASNIHDQINIDWDKTREVFKPEKETFLSRSKKTLDKYPEVGESLRILAGFGLISMAIIMPGLAAVVAKEIRHQERARYRRMFKRWEDQKLVEISETPEGTMVKITEKGIKKALKYKMEEMKIPKPGRWDKKWRVVIFDVSEKHRGDRDVFRGHLQKLGFYMLNRSVFVHPYPCFNQVEFLREVSGVGGEVTYLLATQVESSKDLERHFDLK